VPDGTNEPQRFLHVRKMLQQDPAPKPPAKPRKSKPSVPKPHVKAEAVAAHAGKAVEAIADAVGISTRHVNHIEREAALEQKGYDRAMVDIYGAADFAKVTAKKKLDVAIKFQQKEYDRLYQEKFRAAVKEHVEKIVPGVQEAKNKAADARRQYQKMFDAQKMKMTPEDYKTVLRCLHPDSNPSAEIRSEAFRLFRALKFALTGEE
jgi:hypothetical protein